MNKGLVFATAALTATIAPLAACASQSGNQSTTSPSSSPPGTERMTTQVKSADGTQVANATFDFANGYATVTVEAGPNQVLSPGFHGLQIHSVGKCEGTDFSSAGSVYQAPGHTGSPASGDLTALQVRSDGSAKLVTTSNSFTAADLRSSSGTALVIHQTADNLGTTPTGESSKHIACGVIAAAAATTTSSTTETTSVTTVTTTTAVPPASTSTSTSTVTVTSAPTVTSTPSYTVTTTPPSLPPSR
ncbi:superoxide dismutase [Mycobacterium sp. 852002-50816_SCH5313054-b]|uniref:superoxide dismutase family protein n=1 Tax=Mycobacterium sp. 852002-50816_SCH5313054-b TaxID=1834092 RepID=UPI0007FBEFD9|nr:superoxide dismutase family protein [Mycobacterium sp. 852002-50816_SCH5313054-b]OBF60238.1 superoxide dismutase [Mycobacterium sp. 852002-50816_SCH5313054-b]